MQLSVDLIVSDVRASADFYRKVGLDVPDVWEVNGVAHHVEIPGGLMLNSQALTHSYAPEWNGPGTIFIVQVEDREAVDSRFKELTAAGYVSYLAPFDAFWGSRYAVVDDPDGNHVGVMSPQVEEHKQAPTL